MQYILEYSNFLKGCKCPLLVTAIMGRELQLGCNNPITIVTIRTFVTVRGLYLDSFLFLWQSGTRTWFTLRIRWSVLICPFPVYGHVSLRRYFGRYPNNGITFLIHPSSLLILQTNRKMTPHPFRNLRWSGHKLKVEMVNNLPIRTDSMNRSDFKTNE